MILALISEGKQLRPLRILNYSNWISSIRNAVATILKIAFGVQVAGNDDPLILTLEDNVRRSAQVFSDVRVLFLPICVLSSIFIFFIWTFPLVVHMPNWFPGTGFSRSLKVLFTEMAKSEHKPFYWAKEQIVRDRYSSFSIESLTI